MSRETMFVWLAAVAVCLTFLALGAYLDDVRADVARSEVKK